MMWSTFNDFLQSDEFAYEYECWTNEFNVDEPSAEFFDQVDR